MAIPNLLQTPVSRPFPRMKILSGLIFLLCSGSQAEIIVQVHSAASDWRSIYDGFGYRESFENPTLLPGLSITLAGGAFPSAQTYASLPRVFDPTTIPAGLWGGPEPHNVWDGDHVVTNLSYRPSQPSGANWSSNWDGTIHSQAASITFDLGLDATSLGVGLANFQALSPLGSGYFPITNHRLYINGVALSQDLEAMSGSSRFPSTYEKNGYLTLTATNGDVIRSIGFEDISPFCISGDTRVTPLISTPWGIPQLRPPSRSPGAWL